ncbi:winged helix-turn-helix domain-containing protein [Candidatus Thorarchaeota archaeon]|nr:MAG: winged helix-turn-helix domain-containing protein [Candidatus Thorarchaeota archaeon]
MTSPEDTVAARTTLRIAGVFQEIRDSWVRRLDSYFNQLESLSDGDWIDAQDLTGIIREARLASREAIDGLGNDLSSELIHSSNGIITRYEAERASLQEEINDLRRSLSRALSGDANSIRRENESLRYALSTIPEFSLLKVIQKNRRSTFDQLAECTGLSKAKVRKYTKELVVRGHINVDKKSRPHQVIYLSTPWSAPEPEVQCTLETTPSPIQYEQRIERL